MEKSFLGTNIIAQIGIVVKNIDKTAKKFAEFLGMDIPEIVITDEFEKAQTIYKNNETRARAKLAFFKPNGGLEIELIEPDEHPSTWREHLETKGEGFHHIAFYIKDMQGTVTKLAEYGMSEVQKAEYTGGRYSYIDSFKDLKIMIELLEND